MLSLVGVSPAEAERLAKKTLRSLRSFEERPDNYPDFLEWGPNEQLEEMLSFFDDDNIEVAVVRVEALLALKAFPFSSNRTKLPTPSPAMDLNNPAFDAIGEFGVREAVARGLVTPEQLLWILNCPILLEEAIVRILFW